MTHRSSDQNGICPRAEHEESVLSLGLRLVPVYGSYRVASLVEEASEVINIPFCLGEHESKVLILYKHRSNTAYKLNTTTYP